MPDPFDVSNLRLTTEFTFGSDFSSDFLYLGGKGSELVNHAIDGVDEVQHLSGYADTDDLLGEITSSDSRLIQVE